MVSPGRKTIEIDQWINAYMRDHNAVPATLGYRGYPASCCISVNDVICHGIPGELVIKEGDIVNIDVTPVLNGYYGDTCRMYKVGEVSEEAEHVLRVAKECLRKGIEVCQPENKIGAIGAAIARYAEQEGCSVVYQFCGHGVGVKFHEEPEVCHKDKASNGPKMRPGMTFTIEPMINAGKARAKIDKDGWTARTIDGRLSAQFEHTVLITETGVEVLTDLDGEFPIT